VFMEDRLHRPVAKWDALAQIPSQVCRQAQQVNVYPPLASVGPRPKVQPERALHERPGPPPRQRSNQPSSRALNALAKIRRQGLDAGTVLTSVERLHVSLELSQGTEYYSASALALHLMTTNGIGTATGQGPCAIALTSGLP
jgi:hypothetical protein